METGEGRGVRKRSGSGVRRRRRADPTWYGPVEPLMLTVRPATKGKMTLRDSFYTVQKSPLLCESGEERDRG